MSVNELELRICHLALIRIDVESPERQDGQRVLMEAIRGEEGVLDLQKVLFGLLL
jgi:hypothetical protein